MANVEYVRSSLYSTTGAISVTTPEWTYPSFSASYARDIISPIIHCTENEFADLFGELNFPGYNSFGIAVVALPNPLDYNSFRDSIGIDLRDIVINAIVESETNYNNFMDRYSHILPTPAVVAIGPGGVTSETGGTLSGYVIVPRSRVQKGIEMTNYTGALVTSGDKFCYLSISDIGESSVVRSNLYLNFSTVPAGVMLVRNWLWPGTTGPHAGGNGAHASILFLTESNLYEYLIDIRGPDYDQSGYVASAWVFRYKDEFTSDLTALRFVNVLSATPSSSITYNVSVINGTGSGDFKPGNGVTIVASSSIEGAIFAHWEFSRDVEIQYGALNTAALTFIMPSYDVTATAVFLNPDTSTYSLTVQNGSGTGLYAENADVTIVANRRENLIFAHWDVSVVGTVDSAFSINWTYGGVNTASASFKMPAKNLVITAAYVNDTGVFPYAGGGSSTASGGGGGWNTPDHDVGVPSLPSANVSAVNAGLITMYNPTVSELQSLGSFLWSDNFITDFADNVKKLLTNPMDCIISLHVIPYNVPRETTTSEVRFGMISSGVAMHRITTQYVEFDCGTIDIPRTTGSFLDFTPHTKYSLFLPFIGSVQLDADEITPGESPATKPLNVKYHIDLLSGACVAFVTSSSQLIGVYNGQCSNPIPVTGANYSRLIASILGTIAGIPAFGLAWAGAGAATSLVTSGALQAAGTQLAGTQAVASLGRAFNETGHWGRGIPGVADVRQQLRDAMATANAIGNNPPEPAANTVRSSAHGMLIAHESQALVNSVMNSKGQIQHSGSMGGSSGFLGKRTPYLIITRPSQAIPNNYGHFYGYPSNMSGTIGGFSGYTVFDAIEATSITGTDGEMQELIELLKGGVYL